MALLFTWEIVGALYRGAEVIMFFIFLATALAFALFLYAVVMVVAVIRITVTHALKGAKP